MSTYLAMKTLIQHNRYTYADMSTKLDLFLALNHITMEEFVELTGMMARPEIVMEEHIEVGKIDEMTL